MGLTCTGHLAYASPGRALPGAAAEPPADHAHQLAELVQVQRPGRLDGLGQRLRGFEIEVGDGG